MILLQKPDNCQIIQSARDDTSSLLWLRDDESYGTRKSTCIENLELLDASFTFDREIFSSKAYLAAMRSNIKNDVKEAYSIAQAKHAAHDDVEDKCKIENTEAVTGDTGGLRGLSEDFEVPSVVGNYDFRADTCDNGQYDLHRNSSVHSATAALDGDPHTMEQSSPLRQWSSTPEQTKHDLRRPGYAGRRLIHMPSLLKSRSSTSSQTSSELDSERRTSRPAVYDEAKLLLIGSTKSSASTILKSMELAYGNDSPRTQREMPSTEDDGVREIAISRYSAGVRYNYRIYDVVGLHSKENKWIYSFDEMSTMVYIVDISAYNLPASGEFPSSCVQGDLALFQQICSSRWLATTPILLLLGNSDIMKSKLRDFPLQDHFQDYAGSSTDVAAAKSFFRQKFLCLNKNELRIRVMFTDSVATVKLGKAVVAMIDRILIQGTILSFGMR